MTAHTWRFFRSGGVNQVQLETSDDLRNLGSLDQKLWVALACPTSGLEIDERLLALVDGNGDGRVRAPELLAAVAWTCKVLKEPASMLKGGDLTVSNVREDTAEGKALLVALKAAQGALGKAGAGTFSVADAAAAGAAFAALACNGDGVVTEDSSEDGALDAVIAEIVASVGGVKDRSGKDGADKGKVDAFFAACAAFSAWSARAGAEAATLLPLGDATAGAVAALEAVRAKVDDFFARVRVAEYDARGAAALNWSEAQLGALGGQLLGEACAETESYPLALVAPGASLPLSAGLNPAWAGRVAALRDQVVTPLLGARDTLDAAGWAAVKGRLAPWQAWQGGKAGAEVAGLGEARINAILSSDLRPRLEALIAADEARRPEADALVEVERAARYHASLGRLLRNFVNFSDFYGRKVPAVWQVGQVIFDQRATDLVFRVGDAGRHGAMAGLSSTALMYLDCTRKSDGLKLTVAAAVTDGDADNLMVGRNGLFYDMQGRDYDAQISKIVSNPISLREAFWSPYVKFLRMIEELISKRAAAAEAESQAKVGAAAEKTANADKTAAPPPEAKPSKIDTGTVAALGVAVGGITAAFSAILGAFFGLGMWMPLGLLGLVLLISGPSVFIAWLKLRRRNIGPILDADGWAVNTNARINIPFGRSLTHLAHLPEGAQVDMRDPYEQKSGWKYWVFLIILAALGGFLYAANKGIIVVQGITPTEEPAPAEAPPAS